MPDSVFSILVDLDGFFPDLSNHTSVAFDSEGAHDPNRRAAEAERVGDVACLRRHRMKRDHAVVVLVLPARNDPHAGTATDVLGCLDDCFGTSLVIAVAWSGSELPSLVLRSLPRTWRVLDVCDASASLRAIAASDGGRSPLAQPNAAANADFGGPTVCDPADLW